MNTIDKLNKLAKWRNTFAGWQLGTRLRGDGEFEALRHHRELSILLRAELSALTGLLMEKGVITQPEFEKALGDEAEQLDKDYELFFPGFSASQDGMVMQMPQAAQTMADKGFPP